VIEAKAIVTRLGDGKIWLASKQSGACGGCGQQSGCVSATLAKAFPAREFEIDCDTALNIGDQVLVAIPEQNLLAGSFVMYMLPLLTMLVGVFIVTRLLPINIDDWLPVIAVVFLLAGFRLINHVQPAILYFVNVKPRLLGKV